MHVILIIFTIDIFCINFDFAQAIPNWLWCSLCPNDSAFQERTLWASQSLCSFFSEFYLGKFPYIYIYIFTLATIPGPGSWSSIHQTVWCDAERGVGWPLGTGSDGWCAAVSEGWVQPWFTWGLGRIPSKLSKTWFGSLINSWLQCSNPHGYIWNVNVRFFFVFFIWVKPRKKNSKSSTLW